MIIYPNGSFVTLDGNSNYNFADIQWKDKVLVVDDNSEKGKYILGGGVFNVVLKDDAVIDVEKVQKPEEVEGKTIQLIKNQLGEWEYIYINAPLKKEQELDRKLHELQVAIDTILGGEDIE